MGFVTTVGLVYLGLWTALTIAVHRVDRVLFLRVLRERRRRVAYARYLKLPTLFEGALVFAFLAPFFLVWPLSALWANRRSLGGGRVVLVLRHPLLMFDQQQYAVLSCDPDILARRSKLFCHALFQGHGVRHPRLLGSLSAGAEPEWVRGDPRGVIVVKPKRGSRGDHVRFVDTCEPGWLSQVKRDRDMLFEEAILALDETGRAQHYRVTTLRTVGGIIVFDRIRYTQPDPAVRVSNRCKGAVKHYLTEIPAAEHPAALALAAEQAKQMHAASLLGALLIAWDVVFDADGHCFLEANFGPRNKYDPAAVEKSMRVVRECDRLLRQAGETHARRRVGEECTGG